MRTTNTFGVQFITRTNKAKDGLLPIYARVTVDGRRVEISLKRWIKRIRPANYILIPVTLFRNFAFEVHWGIASYGEVARVVCLWCALVFVQTRLAASRMD